MIVPQDLTEIGFKLSDEDNGELRIRSNEMYGVFIDEDGDVFIREQDNFHGLTFRGLKSINDFKTIWELLTGNRL